MITKEHITVGLRKNGDLLRPAINKDAEIHLFGQEVNPETWAVSKSDLFMKDPTGRDADNITYGSTLSNDRHAGQTFDYLIANPPYGKDWKRDEDAVRAEHERGRQAGSPRAPPYQRRPAPVPAAHAGAREGAEGRRLTHRDHHERLAPLHGRRRQRRERDPPLHSGTRPAGGADRAAGTAFLQHWHRHLRVGGDQPQGVGAHGQGAAHRRDLVLDADAQESRRQATRDPARARTGHPEDPRQLRGRRSTQDHQRWKGRGNGGQPHLPDDALRLSQDHRRATASAQLPGQRRAHRPPRRREGLPDARAVEEEGRRRARRSRPRAVCCRRRSASSCAGFRTPDQGPRRVRARARRGRAQGWPEAACAGPQGDPLGPLRAR